MPEAARPRILIADDHKLIAEAFKSFLANDFDVIATVHDGRSLIQAANTLRPDVILADIGMAFLNGLRAAERVKRVLPEVKVIFVTINQDPGIIAEAFRLGGSGYLLKTSAASELARAIRYALQGKPYLSPSLAASMPELLSQLEIQPSGCNLTDRQVEVLQLLAEGRSMKETAAVLNLATRTIAFHKYRIMDSLGVHSDAEMVQYAMREHIVFT